MHFDQGKSDIADELHELIIARPGQTRSDLRRTTSLAWGTISHHVDRLLAAGKVQVLDDPKHQYLFDAGISPSAMRRHVTLSRPFAYAVMALFTQNKELDTPAVIAGTGLSRRVVSSRLQEMEDAGIIERRTTGRPRYGLPLGFPMRSMRAPQPQNSMGIDCFASGALFSRPRPTH